MRRILPLFVVVSIAALVAASCGGGGGSSDDQAFIDAISAQMMEENDPEAGFTEANADCAADVVVDVIGTKRLIELGLTLEAIEAGESLEDSDLERAEAEELTDAVISCFDFGEILASQFPGELSEKSKQCLGDKMSDTQFFRDAMVAGMLGGSAPDFSQLDQATQADFAAILTGCLTSEELVELGKASSSDSGSGSVTPPTAG